MRIGFLIGTLDVGGTEKQLVQLCRHLDRNAFSPEVFCMIRRGTLGESLVAAGVPVRSFGMSGFQSPFTELPKALTFARAVKSRQLDLLISVLPQAVPLGALAATLAGVPVFMSWRRSVSPLLHSHPLSPALLSWANRRTDVVIANSAAVKGKSTAQEGLSTDLVRVIHNGVDTPLFSGHDQAAMRRRFELPATGPIALVLANFLPYKGHAVFLAAWQQVHRTLPGAIALLVGSGPALEDTRIQAERTGLHGSLRFTGTRLDIPELLTAADLLIHPSFEEGFPNAVLEGMAAGKPVVASHVGGIPEAVRHEETGLLVPPGHSEALAANIIHILERPAIGTAMGQAGCDRVTRLFPFGKMVREYEALFREFHLRRGAS